MIDKVNRHASRDADDAYLLCRLYLQRWERERREAEQDRWHDRMLMVAVWIVVFLAALIAVSIVYAEVISA